MDTSYQIKRTLKKIKSDYLSENIHGHFPLDKENIEKKKSDYLSENIHGHFLLDKENIEEKKELLFIRKHTWTLHIR